MIKTIDFGGEKRPVKFSMNALCEFGDLTDTTALDFERFEKKGMSYSEVRALIYAGLKEGYRVEKKDFDATLEDVGDWIGEDIDKIQEFIEVFTDQMPKSKKATAP